MVILLRIDILKFIHWHFLFTYNTKYMAQNDNYKKISVTDKGRICLEYKEYKLVFLLPK